MQQLTTVDEAKEFLRTHVDAGARCPCCRQFVKAYRRALNTGMARALIAMTHMPKSAEGWVDVKALPVRGGDYAKLRYWGLIEARVVDEKMTGYWRLTARGARFVADRERVPKYARVYDGVLRSLEGDEISIRQALGTRFDYEKLMAGE